MVASQDKYGEVCPANWTEGSNTIKTDPVGKLEYFSASNGAQNGHSNGTSTNGESKKRPRLE